MPPKFLRHHLRHHLRQTTAHTTVIALVAVISAPMATIVPAVADDTVIDSAVTTTNGGATLNGNDSLTITQSGSVTTSGTTQGAFATGGGNSISNAGAITTGGNNAIALRTHNDDNTTITNSGTISTTGSDALGIRVGYSDGVNLTNTGAITTNGESAYGIDLSASHNATITISGSITTNGFNAKGIYAIDSDDMTLTHSGSITTNGQTAHGISFHTGYRANITVSGTVTTNGSGAIGIRLSNGADNTLTVSGSVISNKANAISIDTTNTTLNLNAPAFIGGGFDLGTSTELNIKTALGHSFLWTFDPTQIDGGAPNISGPVPVFQGTSGSNILVTTFEPTGLTASSDSLAGMTGLLSGITQTRLSASNSGALGYADSSTTIIDETFAEVETVNKGWAKVVGSFAAYEGSTNTLDSNHRQFALAAGYDWALSGDAILGFMAGYTQGSVTSDSSLATSVDNGSKGLFIGGYGQVDFDDVFARFGLTAGMGRHEDDRLVNDNLAPLGIAHAIGEYDSFWISPEVTFGINYALNDGWTATPSVRLSYAGQWMDGYTETGTSANATIGQRQVGVAEVNLDYAATHQIDNGSLTARVGYAYRASVGDSTSDVTLLGTTKVFANNNVDRHVAYLGGEAFFNINEALDVDVMAQVEFSDDHIGHNGSIKLTRKF